MRKHAKISPKDQEILNYVVAFKRSHDGNSPTIREIGDACGVNSTSTVRFHLNRLERFGEIERPGEVGESRMIRVIGGRWLPPAHLKVNVTPQEQEYQDAEKLLLVVSRKQPIHTS